MALLEELLANALILSALIFVVTAVLHQFEAMWETVGVLGLELCLHGRLLQEPLLYFLGAFLAFGAGEKYWASRKRRKDAAVSNDRPTIVANFGATGSSGGPRRQADDEAVAE